MMASLAEAHQSNSHVSQQGRKVITQRAETEIEALALAVAHWNSSRPGRGGDCKKWVCEKDADDDLCDPTSQVCHVQCPTEFQLPRLVYTTQDLAIRFPGTDFSVK